MSLGTDIRDYLKENGLKQTYVAQQAGIEVKRFNAQLNENRPIYAKEYFDICRVLKVPLEKFITLDESAPVAMRFTI